MATPAGPTHYNTSDANVRKHWATKLDYQVARKADLTNPERGHISTTGNTAVHEKTHLQKGKGDRIRFQLLRQLQGRGRVEGDPVEGREEGLKVPTFDLEIGQLSHAARHDGEISLQRVPWDVLAALNEQLAQWWAVRLEVSAMLQACGYTATSLSDYFWDSGGTKIPGNDTAYSGLVATTAPDDRHIFRPGAVATDELVQADTTKTLSPGLIQDGVAKMKLGQVPIREVSHGSYSCYELWAHVNQLRSFKDSGGDYYAVMRDAMRGGHVADNPLLTGATGSFDGVLIFESSYITPGVHSSTAAPLDNTRRAVFMGAQALAYARAFNGRPTAFKWVTQTRNYEEFFGVAAFLLFGMEKTKYDIDGTTRDFGTMVLTTYAAEQGDQIT